MDTRINVLFSLNKCLHEDLRDFLELILTEFSKEYKLSYE